MSLAAGSRCGPYEITAPLGAGGMGEVYRARDPRLGRDVAIKMLPAALAVDPDRLARFRREAQTLAALNHPNIASIYGLEDAAGLPCLVLELVEGETLAARLERDPPTLRDSVTICVQVAAAIEAAHERGIVHRDLKPGNIMLSTAGPVKVLDFGLAKSDPVASEVDLAHSPTMTAYADATVPGVILGTAAYMSPEQARGRPVDRRSDVWSFGCILFECLARSPAFAGDTTSDLIARILEREPDWAKLPAATPARVREIVRRCLRKDAAERPRDIRDVRLELAGAAGNAANAREQQQSIAVLPFENLSGADDEFFADGITDEILNALAHLDGLRVAARTSCFAFKGKRADLREVAGALDVATVLEGSVRRAGNRLRITTQLVNATDGYQLWSERYDREMTDVFAVQDEIASAIATRLRGTMLTASEGAKVRVGTKNVEAYEMFLKGRALQNQRGGSILRAIGWFEKAIALDPGYAEPLAWVADSWRLLGTYGMAAAHDVMPKSRAAAERALGLDPDQPEALSTLADIEQQYEFNVAKATALWDRVLELNPRYVRARCERALWLAGPGYLSIAAALDEMAQAAADEPLNSWVAGMHSMGLGFARRGAAAVAEAQRAVELSPESFFAHFCVMQAEAWSGNHTAAVALAPGLLAMSGRNPWGLGTLCWSLAKLGEHERAAAVFDEIEARSRHEFVSPSWLAAAAASVGRLEEALRLAARAMSERDPILVISRIMPQFDAVRDLPNVRDFFDRYFISRPPGAG